MEDVFRIYTETVGATTPLASYRKALTCLLATGGPCYLVVDGLDECSKENRRLLLGAFLEFMDFAKILIISRWERWIEGILPLGAMTSKITISPEHTKNDFERYIRVRLSNIGIAECD